jgi:hypothetical protein
MLDVYKHMSIKSAERTIYVAQTWASGLPTFYIDIGFSNGDDFFLVVPAK